MTAAKKAAAKVATKPDRSAKKVPARKATSAKSATGKRPPARTTTGKAAARPATKSATKSTAKAAARRPAPDKTVRSRTAGTTAPRASKTAKDRAATKNKRATPPPKKAPTKQSPTKQASARSKAEGAAAKKAPSTKTPSTLDAPSAPRAPSPPEKGPYAADEKFLGEQRDLLFGERSTYEGQAQSLRAEADSLALEREPGDVQFDEESGEGGTVTVDRERNLALSAQATLAVEEIDDALRKIERKTYGSCERCHQPIPKARLRALPFARLCVGCKSGGLSRR
ncbi:MAG TPA: TraR/DksA C4-type zinc finger protein [Acidimicrobiales bacterium]|nr:TraR/DksA C4-type zinc finger protein [Acidimicrobiales bacterium]